MQYNGGHTNELDGIRDEFRVLLDDILDLRGLEACTMSGMVPCAPQDIPIDLPLGPIGLQYRDQEKVLQCRE